MISSSVVPPTVAEIDLTAFTQNVHAVRARLSASCELMAVVKANAYGHGAIALAESALQAGATWLAVARCDEGMVLRLHGIDAPILLLGPVWPGEVDTLLTYRLTPVIGSLEAARLVQQQAQQRGQRVAVHVNVDTGMGRLGLQPHHIPALLDEMETLTHLDWQGVMTHLATADHPDERILQEQWQGFCRVVQTLHDRGVAPRYLHAANSAALYRFPQTHGQIVRPGLALYGVHPFEAPAADVLRPVLRWKTRLARLATLSPGHGVSYGHTFVASRPSRIGTLPVGYADGLCRRLSNVGEVLVHGQRAPFVGQITMDMCMIDVTDIPQAQMGDEVVLIGAQGSDRITVEAMASHCGQSPYEVFCAISARVPRRYIV
ncbi:alanine racemase [Candidatus Entotheonella palauensis]|uniref:alanine racemase n=1 Tax=Candidatus Entotheonella palauensis TaxID=93172 RepID=UPI000B7DF81B|nr:alanine racemase [Candidatus Entotheonella palauensis]